MKSEEERVLGYFNIAVALRQLQVCNVCVTVAVLVFGLLIRGSSSNRQPLHK